jgi:hypothetical protein
MAYLRSITGLKLATKYVSNWYSVLVVYLGIKSSTKARFRDGKEIAVSKVDYNEFQEEVFKRYMQDRGYRYSTREGKKLVSTPDGLQIMYLKIPYSFILDGVFVTREYGEYDLRGRVVIDVGTYMAETCLYFVKQGASRVFGFEINIENYNIGLENTKLNNMTDKIQLYHQPATYESIRNLITLYDLKDIFLKIDCEGCEYEIIENADPITFENINDIVLEYHRQSEPLMQKLIKLGYGVRKQGMIFQPHQGIIFATKKVK